MAMSNMSKSVVRTGKNYLKGFTGTQIKVRDATSNDPWGPSGTQMNELAQLSYNQYVAWRCIMHIALWLMVTLSQK